MKHLLMHPAYPDLVAEWAAEDAEAASLGCGCANDNISAGAENGFDPLLDALARLEVELTRAW
jgi:hypothetical protein